MDFARSHELQERAHRLIPGGAHTYAKGDDQYPREAPGFFVRGEGCRSWDPDGNCFVEYGMGLRSVTLGHGYEPVVRAAQAALAQGTNFIRPHVLEADAAERLLGFLGRDDGEHMVKFAKNGSDVTTAAVRLARAATGRDLVALCSDHPFFSTDDWFITTTAMSAGIPRSVAELTVGFHYNDLASLDACFDAHPDRIAAVVMEGESSTPPQPGFLEGVARICRERGAVFVLDEMITGFRLHQRGAQGLHGIDPDLATYGKALGNGMAVSALVGRRELMELGGLHTERERVFLLSTTFGGETHALAAAMAVMDAYESEPVIEHMWRYGERLADAVRAAVADAGLDGLVGVEGRPCNLLFFTKDPDGNRSQPYRTLFIQELVARGVIGPSFVDSYAHDDAALDQTVEAVRGALEVYRRAVDAGTTDGLLIGPPSKVVFRRYV